MDPNFEDIEYRDSDEVTEKLNDAWLAFCKDVRRDLVSRKKLTISARQVFLLKFASERSIYPMKPAIMDFPKLHENHSWYLAAIHDKMHTVGGLLEGWVSTTIVICSVVGSMPEYRDHYRHNLGVLDELLSGFPRDHSAPFNMRHFKDGVTCFCPIKQGNNAKKGSGTGVLGMMNHQEVPGLVLQILCCKSLQVYILKYY